MNKKVMTIPAVAIVITAMTVSGCGTSTTTKNTASSAPRQSAFPVTLTDDTGHSVKLSKQPTRIASVTEGTDEIVSALVPKKDIVLMTSLAANPTYSNIVSFAKGIPSIQQADAEQIIAAKPDLVLLASYTKPGVVNQIEQAGITAYEFNDFTSIKDIEKNVEVVGKLVGSEAKAKQVVQNMESQLAAIHQAVAGQKPVTVLDDSSFGYAAGSATTVNDIIVDAGGTNVAAKLNGWQKVTDEEIVKMNPDVIIDSSDDTGFVQKVLNDPALKSVSAVKHHRVYAVKAADLTSTSQYVTNGVRDVAKLLYPQVKLPQ